MSSRLVQLIDEKVLPRRYWVLGCVTVLVWVTSLCRTHAAGGDWVGFVNDVHSLRDVPKVPVYIGPVMLLFVWPFSGASVSSGWIAASAVCMMLGLVTIRCVEQTAEIGGLGTRRDRERAVLLGGVFLLLAWSLPGARWGHADDVIVLTCVALAGRALIGGRWLWASFAIGVAIDTKPWAALVLPLAAACSGKRLRGLAVVILGVVATWIPFIVLHHGHLDTSSLNLPVAPDSDLRYLGVAVGSLPGWPRALQLAVALPLGTFAVAKRRWYLVPAIAFAVRIDLDPATWSYYMTGAVFGLFVWDLMRPTRAWGVRTALGWIALVLLPMDADLSYLFGAAWVPFLVSLRLLAAVVPLAVLFGPSYRLVRRGRGSLP